MLKSLKNELTSISAKRLAGGLFVLAFAAVGSYILFSAHASTVTAASEAESGTLVSPATTVSDSSASGGSAVKFGSSPSGGSGFVTTSGQSFMLNGQPIKFIGFNPNGMIGDCWSGNNWTTAQMDTYFSNLPPNGISRIFAVANNAGGVGYVQTIVQEAAKYNQHLIIGLSDGNSNCSDFIGAGTNGVQGSGKTLTFYQSGWKSQYLTWLNQVVTALKDSPNVAVWEIQNEPFHSGNGEGGVTVVGQGIPLSTAESFVNGAAAAIRADDPNHLVSIAPADVGDMGGESDYQALFTNLDVLDFHDYSWDWGGGATISGDLSEVKQAATALNKPYMADEIGVSGGAGCTSSTPNPNTADSSSNVSGFSLANRKTWLINKVNTELSSTGTNGGMSGAVFWNYLLPSEGGYSCGFNMSPTDPMISAVNNYVMPN